MASSYSVAWTTPLRLVLVIVVLLLSSISALAATEPPRASAWPPAAVAGHARQDFQVARAPLLDAIVTKNGAGRRPSSGMKRRRRRPDPNRGRGTGAWAFSAMLPRGFVPPSDSSACHNDMPAAAAYAQFYTCGSSGSP